MTSILGISAFYHDSAAALIVDGRIVAAGPLASLPAGVADGALWHYQVAR